MAEAEAAWWGRCQIWKIMVCYAESFEGFPHLISKIKLETKLRGEAKPKSSPIGSFEWKIHLEEYSADLLDYDEEKTLSIFNQ